MPQWLADAIGTVLRSVLMGAAGWLVSQGLLTAQAAEQLVVGVTAAIIAIAWSLYQKYRSRVKVAVALDMPSGSSATALKERIEVRGL